MADLSPAALSVWCRFCEVVEEHGPPRLGLAAALRAAADQLAQVPIVIGEPLRRNIAKDAAVIHVADLFAIATELENQ